MRFLVLLLIGLFSGAAMAAELPADNTAWLKLLHYQKTFGGYQGLIINDDFYLAATGRIDPQAEMAAEIKAFAAADNTDKCNFPARFKWLKEQGLVAGNLDNCTDYQQLLQDVQPAGITLLFTNAYMSNPASLFGHTLVRIDTKRQGTQMLAHGSNFGANSGTEQGVIFALKGLFGGYDGSYSLSPYWTVINTYNNIENRDIWEYKLNLSDAEAQKFVDHLYEMRNAKIQYFFLNKNCSYMILELLEAVRPELELAQDYQWWAIPLDTLKTVKAEPDLVGDINYRPARYTKIQAQLKAMNKAEYAAFLKGINDHDYTMDDLSTDEQAAVLETLYQYYQYQYTAQKMELKEYRKNSFAVLRRRSQMPTPTAPTLTGEDPSLSHDSFQIAVGGGTVKGQSFTEATIRPAYTALTDSHFGLIKGAGVEVLKSRWRYYHQRHKLVLQDFTGLDIVSLVPSDRVFHPISYVTNFSLKREYNPKTLREGYAGAAHFGLGQTYALGDSLWLYGLVKASGEYGGFLSGNGWVAAAPEVGVYSSFWRLHIHAAAEQNFATRVAGQRLIYKGEVALELTKNTALALEYRDEHNAKGHNRQEIMGQLRYMF